MAAQLHGTADRPDLKTLNRMKPTLETLLDEWETGNLDADGQKQLAEHLQTTEARATLAQRWVFESVLDGFWQDESAADKVVEVEPARFQRRPLVWALGAAALLLLTVTGLWFATQPPESPAVVSDSPALAEAPAPPPVERETLSPTPSRIVQPLDVSGHWTVTKQDPMFVVMGPWRFKAYPDTRFRLVPTRGALVLELLQGAVRMEVSAAEPSGLQFRTRDLQGDLAGGDALLISSPESSWLAVGEGEATVRRYDDPALRTLARGELIQTASAHPFQASPIEDSAIWSGLLEQFTGDSFP